MEPRRSTRQRTAISKPEQNVTATSSKGVKRKTQDIDQVEFLLHNPKSALTTMDISNLINANTWSMLSEGSQALLAQLLPATAFLDFEPSLDASHPSGPKQREHPSSFYLPTTLNDTVFTDSHFLAAAHTFQDHIFSGWMQDAHASKMKQFQDGIHDGTLSAPWKDEVWERENATELEESSEHRVNPTDRTGEATVCKLPDLAKNGVLLIGDMITYRRNFSAMSLTIEKDVLIQSTHPRNHSLTVLFEPGSTKALSAELLIPSPSDPSGPTLSATITSPSMLETAILDTDGRVERSRRPNGNAWKCFSVWRWRDQGYLPSDERGGRENHGTLFYLRGSYHR